MIGNGLIGPCPAMGKLRAGGIRFTRSGGSLFESWFKFGLPASAAAAFVLVGLTLPLGLTVPVFREAQLRCFFSARGRVIGPRELTSSLALLTLPALA